MSDYVHKDSTSQHSYVTSPSLDPETASTCDIHGVYPVDPLGFPDTGKCGDDPECLGNANPEFPQAGNFSVDTVSGEIPRDYVEVASPVKDMTGTRVLVPVISLSAIEGSPERYLVKVPGDVSAAIRRVPAVTFDNAGYDDYSITGLFPGNSVATGDPTVADGSTSFVINNGMCRIAGHVGEGRLSLVFDASTVGHVLLTAQENPAENGLYKVTGEDDPWVRIASVGRVKGVQVDGDSDPYNLPESLDNSVSCGHVRHGYSDREVTGYVDTAAGNIVSATVHPVAVPGDLAGAGDITRWFVECGDIALGPSHDGSDPVTVKGFGLGGYLSGECTYGDMCRTVRLDRDDGIPVERPVITFSIGTRRPPENASVETLPKDWPFTSYSDYASPAIDNNITLVKKPAHLTHALHSVGGLRHDIYGKCPMCDGTGELEGGPCPECGGEGEIVVAHSESNRIHVCVNNEFGGNQDGTVTPKRTFVHLPAPIDTPDGDEFELTVSMPTVSVPDAYGPDAKKNISAYYEYVSTPRVVVMGGYWKFSDTRIEWKESRVPSERPAHTGHLDIAGSGVHPFVDKEGNPLPVNTRIRFTLDGGLNCPRKADMRGALLRNSEGRVTITALEGYPYTDRLRDLRMVICGAAYLDGADDGLPTATDVYMGLHSRNDTTLVRDDAGSGETGRLDVYNKAICTNAGRAGTGSRLPVSGDDARDILASVYPTATNTFPWEMVGRHRMRHLDRLMTDEWDLGENSVSAMVWDSNKKLIDFNETVGFFGYGDSCYAFTADTMPLRYSKRLFEGSFPERSVIGSQLRIKVSGSAEGYLETASNPVRQARKAAAMLADDFRKLRMFHGGKLPKISGASRIRTSNDPIGVSLEEYFASWNPEGTPSQQVIGNHLASAAWLGCARHLPEYVIVSGQDQGADGNSLVGADPFVDSVTRGRYSAGFASAKYGNGHYTSRDGHEEIPCDPALPGKNAAFAYRSVISARVESDPDAVQHELYDDANRAAELQKVSVDKWNQWIVYDITSPYDYLLDDSAANKWRDIYSATSNVFSIDTVPVPPDCPVPELTAEQRAMVSGDPFVSYRLESGNDIGFVAANLPFYDEGSPRSAALTEMLRRMVPAYGARMPVRFWDGTRVAIATDGVHNDGATLLARLRWPESECAMSATARRDIVDDCFISRTAGSNTVDVNLNRATMETTLHMNWSAPPVKAKRSWYSNPVFTGVGKFAGPSGYVRVFMRFKFSARAGRWYAVDYRQAPMSYLTPLYGARALEEKIGGERLWSESLCSGDGWKDVLMHPYFKYPPMDINPMAVHSLVENVPTDDRIDTENNADLYTSTVSLPRLSRPYLSVADGGIGLNAPCDANGMGADLVKLAMMPHANFWSVRKHLRPAVSAMEGTEVPGFRYEDGKRVLGRKDGTMGDAVLWGQFDFPKKGITEYMIPPDSYGEVGDKLVFSDGDYVSMSDGSLVEMT
jgi:hypothetical protein